MSGYSVCSHWPASETATVGPDSHSLRSLLRDDMVRGDRLRMRVQISSPPPSSIAFVSFRLAFLAALAIAAPTAATAQDAPAKIAHAVRITGAAPRIDGALDDAAWSLAPMVSDFVQKIPVEGATPSVATQVRLLYDDDALYVGARCPSIDANRAASGREGSEKRDRQHL